MFGRGYFCPTVIKKLVRVIGMVQLCALLLEINKISIYLSSRFVENSPTKDMLIQSPLLQELME